MTEQTILPPEAGENDLMGIVYGGVTARFLAVMLDGVFVLIFSMLLFVPLFLITMLANVLIAPLLVWMGAIMIPSFGALYLIVSWFYFATMESGPRGATYGKRFFRLRVINESGEAIGFARASVRFAAKFLSAMPFMLGFLMAFVTRRKQALHDLLAETLVIKV